MIPQLLLTVFISGDLQSVPPPSPQEVARSWLLALARQQREELRQMAAIPIAIGGFQSRLGVCADVPGLQRDPSTLEIEVRVSHENNLDALIACLLGERSHTQWLPRPPDQGLPCSCSLLCQKAESPT